MTFVALWDEKGDEFASYNVNLYFETINGDDYQRDGFISEVGVVGSATDYIPVDYEGFHVSKIDNCVIKADGTSVVDVYYDRNLYSITFVPNNGEDDIIVSEKYDQIIQLPSGIRKTGYEFAEWLGLKEINGKVPSHDVVLTAAWKPSDRTPFKVEVYKQDLNGKYKLDFSLDYTGTTGESTSFSSVDFDGFTLLPFDQEIINADGSTVLKIYYSRNSYNITFDFDNGKDIVTTVQKFDADIVFPSDVKKQGYTFVGWNNPVTKVPAQDCTFTAVWQPAKNTPYRVELYKQNILDDSYTFYKSVDESGTTEEKTYYLAEHLIGFNSKSFDQDVIKADGSTVLKVYYDREVYTLTFVLGNGSKNITLTGRYEAKINYPEAPVKSGYDFAGWSYNGETFESDRTVYANWKPSKNTVYTIECYLQNVEDDEFTLTETKERNGETGSKIDVVDLPEFVGFERESLSGTYYVKADGSTKIPVKYIRKKYTLNLNGKTARVKFGSPISAPVVSEKPGYDFVSWNPPLPETMPAEDFKSVPTFVPRNDTVYKVNVYLENAPSSMTSTSVEYPSTPIVLNYSGTTDSEILFEKEYEGFEVAKTTGAKSIGGDGCSVKDVYYKRKQFALTYLNEDGSEFKKYGVKYGCNIDHPFSDPSREGYYFNEWKVEVGSSPKTMPARDVTFIPTWNARTNMPYTVEVYVQNVEDDEFKLSSNGIQMRDGVTGQETSYSPESSTYAYLYSNGFDCRVENIVIDPMKDNVVKVYYIRQIHKVTIADFYEVDGKLVSFVAEGKCGTSITYPTPCYSKHTFKEFKDEKGKVYYSVKDLPETISYEDKTYRSVWTENKVDVEITLPDTGNIGGDYYSISKKTVDGGFNFSIKFDSEKDFNPIVTWVLDNEIIEKNKTECFVSKEGLSVGKHQLLAVIKVGDKYSTDYIYINISSRS